MIHASDQDEREYTDERNEVSDAKDERGEFRAVPGYRSRPRSQPAAPSIIVPVAGSGLVDDVAGKHVECLHGLGCYLRSVGLSAECELSDDRYPERGAHDRGARE